MKELIKMCDCPEIQERKPDYRGDERIFIQVVTKDGGMTSAYHCDRGVFMDAIYIPRIEDVLEWLGEGMHCLFRQSDEELRTDGTEQERWGVGGFADTPIKALIKAYMHLEHGKTWDGEAWR